MARHMIFCNDVSIRKVRVRGSDTNVVVVHLYFRCIASYFPPDDFVRITEVAHAFGHNTGGSCIEFHLVSHSLFAIFPFAAVDKKNLLPSSS